MFYFKMSTLPAYSLSALMSDIGGSMSLVLGATLLTLVEITEMLSTFVSYSFNRFRVSKVINKNQKDIAEVNYH